ncbi:MAG TPA: GAF domain-containing protein [Chryseosolibacter sp.]
MMELFRDRYKTGLILATLFLIGILVSLYQIYRLPHNMMVAEGYHPALSNVYLILGITFLIGAYTIWSALHNKNEIIVFRDKQTEADKASRENASSGQQTTISLDSVRESISSARNAKDILQNGLHAVCALLEAGQGAAYVIEEKDGQRKVELKSGYALSLAENSVVSYGIGEGLIGQSAASGKTLYIDDVPTGYVKIVSGLGMASPKYLLIVPVKQGEKVIGVMEIASFSPVSEDQRKFVEESAQLVAEKISGK